MIPRPPLPKRPLEKPSCRILTFASEADRDAYLKHPDHVAFGKLLRPVLGDVFVVDFWNKD